MSPRGFVALLVLCSAGCGDETTARAPTFGDSFSGTGDGSTSADTDDPTAISASHTSADGSGDGGTDTDDGCTDADAPQLLSMSAGVFTPGASPITAELEFDREVRIAEGGLSVDAGAVLDAPMLPSSGVSFTVELQPSAEGGPYTLSVDAASVTDIACGLSLDDDATVTLSPDCEDNTAPMLTAAEFHQLPEGSASDVYAVTFDEPVTLQAGAIAVSSGGASIASVSPALPATSDTFSVQVSNLDAITTLTVSAASVTDGCGASLVADASLWICTVESMSFEYTGVEETFSVPACAEGSLSVVARGASGQTAIGGGSGGQGAIATGTLDVVTGELLSLFVGGQDGYNGGGAPGSGDPAVSGSGGGASDVRQAGNALEQRILVAGGGGGGGAPPQETCSAGEGGAGGVGGDPNATSGTNGTGCGAISTGGGGATQAMGGAGGVGGTNCSNTPDPGEPGQLGIGGSGSGGVNCNGSGFVGGGGGGGGGGYYGGGGGAGGPGGSGGSWGGAGGGGGSSYVGGVSGGTISAGAHSGDGDITLSW